MFCKYDSKKLFVQFFSALLNLFIIAYKPGDLLGKLTNLRIARCILSSIKLRGRASGHPFPVPFTHTHLLCTHLYRHNIRGSKDYMNGFSVRFQHISYLFLNLCFHIVCSKKCPHPFRNNSVTSIALARVKPYRGV